jgi:hypothetical protein
VSELAVHWRWVAAGWLEVVLAYGAYAFYLARRARRAGRREDER